MNANCPAQTRDAHPALLLLATALLLFLSLATTHSLSRLNLQVLDLNIPALDATHLPGPALQVQRPPEPPTGGGRPLHTSSTPTPASPAGLQNLAPLPSALPVATPPESH